MSRVVSGWVVSRNPYNTAGLRWQAWKGTNQGTLRQHADTYRGLLAMIREANKGSRA